MLEDDLHNSLCQSHPLEDSFFVVKTLESLSFRQELINLVVRSFHGDYLSCVEQFVEMEVLSFQCAEEAFNRCVVESVAFAAHALLDAMTRQHRSVGLHLVVPTLVGVHDHVSGGLGARERCLERAGKTKRLLQTSKLELNLCHGELLIRFMGSALTLAKVGA